jgi:haloalkane dehalogenase
MIPGMDVLRTPDDRFADLPGFPWEPHYADVPDQDGGELRMSFVDEGPADGPVALLLHGEPSWSFLYRHVIRVLTGRGIRCVAPDLVGFGRSDKPVLPGDHSYARHVEWIRALAFDVLDLGELTLVGQDWGGLIGLRLVAEQPDRFAGVVASNTFLPTGDQPLGDAFHQWRAYSQSAPEFPIGQIVNGGTARDLSAAEIAAYDAPFPDDRYKAGARQFPTLVPAEPDDPAAPANRAAWQVLEAWDKPFVCAFGALDPITRGADRALRERIPGTAGQPHVTLQQAAHFSQEDAGPQLAQILLDLAGRLPAPGA